MCYKFGWEYNAQNYYKNALKKTFHASKILNDVSEIALKVCLF